MTQLWIVQTVHTRRKSEHALSLHDAETVQGSVAWLLRRWKRGGMRISLAFAAFSAGWVQRLSKPNWSAW